MSQPRTPITPDRMERSRFFPQQVVHPQDLAQDCEYLLHRLRRHNRLVHKWGIAIGLKVEVVPDTGGGEYTEFEKRWRPIPPAVTPDDGTWLIVYPGYAITPLGDEIYLPEPIFLNTAEELNGALVAYPSDCGCHTNPRANSEKAAICYLIVEAYESEFRPVNAASTRCGDHPEQLESSRIKDTVQFRLIEQAPQAPYPKDADERKLLKGEPTRSYVSLAEISFANQTAPTVTAAHRDQSIGSEEPQVTVTPAPAANSSILDQLLSADSVDQKLKTAAQTLSSYQRKLLDGLNICLRPKGVLRLLEGVVAETALHELPARYVNYGKPNEVLDKYFCRKQVTVAHLLDASFTEPLISQLAAAEVGPLQVHYDELMKAACGAAALASYLVRKWPVSHL